MKITLKRIAPRATYTIGKLYVDDVYFCDTLEDTDRGLTQKSPLPEIVKTKIMHETAIPYGTYYVTMDIVSPKYSQVQFYKDLCKGKLPRLINVLGFDGILIHAGNTDKDTSGCILVGENKVVGQVLNSRVTFEKLYKKLEEAKGLITIEIVK